MSMDLLPFSKLKVTKMKMEQSKNSFQLMNRATLMKAKKRLRMRFMG